MITGLFLGPPEVDAARQLLGNRIQLAGLPQKYFSAGASGAAVGTDLVY
jgi:hypothetical protein